MCICTHICIYVYMYIYRCIYQYKESNEVSTTGVTANFMFLTEGLFGYSR